MVSAAITTAFAQENAETAHQHWRSVADPMRTKVPKLAALMDEDLARSLRYARIWGQSGFEGQQVGHEHCVADGDIVELHA